MRFRLVLPIALAALAAVPAEASAQQPAAGGVIAFTRDPDGAAGPGEPVVHVAAPDGTGERVYATGTVPALALEGTRIAYVVRVGNAFQVVVGDLRSSAPPVQVTRFADREVRFGPSLHGAEGIVWSPRGEWLAVRIREGSVMRSVALVRPDGSGFRTLRLRHLSGNAVAWRDDETLAVESDDGPKLVTVTGTVRDVPGAAPDDEPVVFQRTGALVVNGADGVAVVEPGGTRRHLESGVHAEGGAYGGGVTYTTTAEIGYLGLDGRATPAAALPEAARPPSGWVLGIVAARTGTLVAVHTRDNRNVIYGLPRAPRPGTPRRILDGADLSLSNAVSVAEVVPPRGGPGTAPTAPGAPADRRPAYVPWLALLLGLAAVAAAGWAYLRFRSSSG